MLAAVGNSATAVALSGGSHFLAETFGESLGSGYKKRLVDYPVLDLRLFMRCLQKVASSVFVSLDPFSNTNFVVPRLKGAEHRKWIVSGASFRRTNIRKELQMPTLVQVIANIVGVWPQIVSYLEGAGKKINGDSLIV